MSKNLIKDYTDRILVQLIEIEDIVLHYYKQAQSSKSLLKQNLYENSLLIIKSILDLIINKELDSKLVKRPNNYKPKKKLDLKVEREIS